MAASKHLSNTYQIEEKLKGLCVKFINVLKDAYDSGILTEDEYLEHVKTKEEFLKKG
ncbi:MAG TPA: SHOCT domain-containing protein [Clostridia bacterium]|nr:SHOCT domain-containing protein [Clostridia bacterium]